VKAGSSTSWYQGTSTVKLRGTSGNGPRPATLTTRKMPMTKTGTPIPTVDSTVTSTSHTE
jgi:hypothetical protein